LFFRNLFQTLIHNVLAAGLGTVLPIAVTGGQALGNGPTGGAAAYASAHPFILPLYMAGFGIAREFLKFIPGVAPSSSTSVGPNAPTILKK
jgi:hypothetical protein